MRRAAIRQSELCAVDLLCRQGFASIFDLGRPQIDRFRLPVTVQFDSYAGFCDKTGVSRASLFPHSGADGLSMRHNGIYLVLYDERVESERRRAFTLAHEIGHILLGHAGGEDAAIEEREANAFAASLLAPAAAVRYLAHREGCEVSEESEEIAVSTISTPASAAMSSVAIWFEVVSCVWSWIGMPISCLSSVTSFFAA